MDGDSLKQRTGLTAFVRDWGPLVLRAIVGFVALFATIAWLQNKNALEDVWGGIETPPVRWFYLAAHFAAMATFAILSAAQYHDKLPGIAPDLLAGGWMTAGLTAIALGALVILPWALWVETLRATGYAWFYSLIAVAAALLTQQASRALWQQAARVTLALVRLILRPFVTVVAADPVAMKIQTPHFRVFIAPECSGLEGAGLLLAFGITFLWLFRKECRFPQCLILIPGGIILLFLLNSVRIAALVLIGEAGARQIAAGGFHSQAGWIAFNSVALTIAIAARRLPWFSTTVPAVSQPSTDAVENPTAAYLLPFLAVLAMGMISRAASGGFEWLYGLRFIAAAGVLWYFRRSYARLDWNFDWFAVATGLLVALLWIAPDMLFHPQRGEMPAALAAAPPLLRISWIALRVLAAVVTVPLSEELAFRGFLLRRLVSADFESVPFRGVHWVALALSSCAFGLLHGGRWLTGIVAGVLFGLVQARRGRIGDAAVAHGVSNALLAAGVLLSGQWQYW